MSAGLGIRGWLVVHAAALAAGCAATDSPSNFAFAVIVRSSGSVAHVWVSRGLNIS